MGLLSLLRRLQMVAYFMRRPDVPAALKALPVLAFAYFVFPRDLMLDLRAFGLIDDFIVAGLLLGVFLSKAAERVARSEKSRQEAVPADYVVLGDEKQPPAGEGGGEGAAPPGDDIRS